MNNQDITELLYRIKENIKIVEGGDVRESLLDEVRSDFLDMLDLIKLFLISERDSYYGYFLMNMQFRADFFSTSIAGIKLNEFPPVFVAKPLLLCKFKLKEIIFCVCHEIDHVVLNHPAEMVKANPEGDQDTFYRFNLAADASVNDRINHEIKTEKHLFMSQPDGVITSKVFAKMFSLGKILPMESYAYYYEFIKNNKKDQQDDSASMNGQQSMMDQQNQKDGTESGSSGSDNKKDQQDDSTSMNGQQSIMDHQNQKDGTDSGSSGSEEKEGKGQGKGAGSSEEGEGQIVTAKNCGGKITDHNWEAGNDAEDAAAAVREFVNASFDIMNEESRGLMPGYFLSQVELINKPPVLSWEAILKKYVGTVSANKRKTRMRLNRRQPERFDLSGRMDEKVLKIVVAIDTSGSMSDHMIGQVMNEIFGILAKRKHDVTVIECDAEIQRVYKVKSPAEVKKKVAGRGGTSFTPVIEYVNDNKYFRDALLIYFTDGYGESSIPKPKTYRNLWVILNGASHLSVNEPYGVVLSLYGDNNG